MVGQAGLEPASLMSSRILSPGRLPIAPLSALIWSARRRSNPHAYEEAPDSESGVYASSTTCREIGAFGESRTLNAFRRRLLRPLCLPISPRTHFDPGCLRGMQINFWIALRLCTGQKRFGCIDIFFHERDLRTAVERDDATCA